MKYWIAIVLGVGLCGPLVAESMTQKSRGTVSVHTPVTWTDTNTSLIIHFDMEPDHTNATAILDTVAGLPVTNMPTVGLGPTATEAGLRADGSKNYCYTFNDAGNYFRGGNGGDYWIPYESNFTVMVWIWTTDVGATEHRRAVSDSGGGLTPNAQWAIGMYNSSEYAWWTIRDHDYDQSTFINLPPAIPTNTWVHFTGVRDGTIARFYTNGILVAAVTNALVSNIDPLAGEFWNIGGNSAGNVGWGGMLDDVRFYASALPVSSITNIVYNTPPTPGLPLADPLGNREAR